MEREALTKLQNEIHTWHVRNYPTDLVHQALLGVGEELGELERAELKQHGGIRGTFEEWEKEKQKEAGDVLIGLLNVSSFVGIDMNDAIKSVEPMLSCVTDKATSLLLIQIAFGKMVENFCSGLAERRARAIGLVWVDVMFYCSLHRWNVYDILQARWATISQRDFIANPATGGREREG
jgi:NTP pyrophosphatase (non-canonical NTP hydrolase)